MLTFELWQRIPARLRMTISVLLRRIGVPISSLHSAAGHPSSLGFATETPDTPPAIEEALKHLAANGPEGDYYEFGLYRGYTFWYSQRAAKNLKLASMQFWGFDSFAGLPEPRGIDAQLPEFRTGDYACGREQVESYLEQYGVDWSRTHLIQGFFSESLDPNLIVRTKMRPVAVALIDCDLYESTVPVLNFLSGLLRHGTILLFDDYNCFGASDEMGERRAFREFLAAHTEWDAVPFISFGWHGEGFRLISRSTIGKSDVSTLSV